MSQRGGLANVWMGREFFTGDFPASTLVEVRSLAKPEVLVEIETVGGAVMNASMEPVAIPPLVNIAQFRKVNVLIEAIKLGPLPTSEQATIG
jgi:hypothetical protein